MSNGLSLVAAAALLALTACASNSAQVETPQVRNGLAGPEWTFFEIGGKPVIADVKATINFKEDQAFGSGSCNRYTGNYTAGNTSQLKLGKMASTMMACLDPAMEQEGRLLKILGDVTSYSIDADGVLTLKTADGQTARARR